MARDDEQVTANPVLTGRGQPIGTTSLHQLDKLELTCGQALAEDIRFIRGIHGDGTNGALTDLCVLVREGISAAKRRKQCGEEKQSGERVQHGGSGTGVCFLSRVRLRN